MSFFSTRLRDRRRLIAVSCAIALVSAAARASQPTPVPPEELVPKQEYTQFFEIVADRAAAGESIAELIPSEEMGPVDAAIEQMFQRGEQVADWSRSGIDLRAVVSARPGGHRANVVRWDGQFGPSTLILADERFEDVVPAEWRLVWTHGQVAAGEASVTSIDRVSPKLAIVERTVLRRRGQALCRERGEARFYMDPGTAGTDADLAAFFITMRAYTVLAGRPNFCTVTTEVQPNVYRDQFFYPEGHRIPAFDEQLPPMRIVPRDTLFPPRAQR